MPTPKQRYQNGNYTLTTDELPDEGGKLGKRSFRAGTGPVILRCEQDLWLQADSGMASQMDTAVEIEGKFSVAGNQFEEFKEKLGALLDEYRI